MVRAQTFSALELLQFQAKDIMTQKVLALLAVLTLGLAGPFVCWVALSLAIRRSPSQLPVFKKRVKTIRLVTWCAAFAFWVFSFVISNQRIGWEFGGAFLTFSLGLAIPEIWLKKKMSDEDTTAGGTYPAAN